MLRTCMLMAMTMFLAAVAAVVAALGGCGRVGADGADAAVVDRPSARKADAAVVIGPGAQRVARVTKTARVEAEIFEADADGGRHGAVTITPGVWLVPTAAFLPPAARDGKE